MTAEKPIPVARLLMRAERSEKNAPDEAADLYRQVFARFPTNARARAGLLRLRRLALRPPPGTEAALKQLQAQAMSAQGAAQCQVVAAALAQLQQRHGPQLILFLIHMLMLERAEAFAQMFDQALAAADAWPRHYLPWLCSAVALRGLKRRAEARKCADMAVDLAPDLADPRLCRARILQDSNRIRQALDEVTQALALDPDNCEALRLYGGIMRDLRRPGDAAAAYRKILAQKPDDWPTQASLGILATSTGDDEAARDHFAAAIRGNPRHGVLHLYYARASRDAPDPAHLQQLRQLAADDSLPPSSRVA